MNTEIGRPRGRGSRNADGFTPTEMLVTVLMVGGLILLAFWFYRPVIERARMTEALVTLGALRDSQYRYFTEYGTFTRRLELLDFDPYAKPVEHRYHFRYEINAAERTHFTATAAGKWDKTGAATVTMDEKGHIGGTMARSSDAEKPPAAAHGPEEGGHDDLS